MPVILTHVKGESRMEGFLSNQLSLITFGLRAWKKRSTIYQNTVKMRKYYPEDKV